MKWDWITRVIRVSVYILGGRPRYLIRVVSVWVTCVSCSQYCMLHLWGRPPDRPEIYDTNGILLREGFECYNTLTPGRVWGKRIPGISIIILECRTQLDNAGGGSGCCVHGNHVGETILLPYPVLCKHIYLCGSVVPGFSPYQFTLSLPLIGPWWPCFILC